MVNKMPLILWRLRGGRERENGNKLTSQLIPENDKYSEENAVENVWQGLERCYGRAIKNGLSKEVTFK